jgi:uridine monophosphate synthetase
MTVMAMLPTYIQNMDFFSKLNAAIARNHSLLCVGLEPNPEVMPIQFSDRGDIYNAKATFNKLWEWMQFIIDQTADAVCAYKPTLGFYLALGSAGLELLEKTLNAIPDEIPVILDAKHGDLNSSSILANTAFTQWQVDAITITPYAGQDLAARFLVYPDKAIFVQCHTANSTAKDIQSYPNLQAPLYQEIVKQCQSWGSAEQLALEVGASDPDALASIRALAPERLILVRSLWASSNLDGILAAGLNHNGEGLIVPVDQDILQSDRPGEIVRSRSQKINQCREQIADRQPSCNLWIPDVCFLEQHPHMDLILQLYDIGCIMFGDYVQASGAVFPYYIDLRKIISNPQVFSQVLLAYASILKDLTFDRIAGIPYGSLPTATGLALHLNRPLIFPRKEVKAHGARRAIEGNFHAGETIAVVDDILITGKSVMEGAEKLKSNGLNVRDIVVLIDHEHGVRDKLAQNGYQGYAVFKISEIAQTLYQAGRINDEQLANLN